ncbi:MAG: hypothetical protein QW376_07735 [Candidatus Caldarchaeum sp.]
MTTVLVVEVNAKSRIEEEARRLGISPKMYVNALLFLAESPYSRAFIENYVKLCRINKNLDKDINDNHKQLQRQRSEVSEKLEEIAEQLDKTEIG